jgi:Uma2 family endonuclease
MFGITEDPSMVVQARVMTADELLRMPDDGFRYELVRGELRRMCPAGYDHGSVAMQIGSLLHQWVVQHGLGRAFAAETGFVLERNPDTVRAPDAAFVRRERLAAVGQRPGYFPGHPDLAVEVVSPGDTRAEVEGKAVAWLAAGTLAVVVADPARRTVSVWRSPDRVVTLRDDDTLDLDDVVPGWAPPVADLFA